ncbi:MAG: hypothetical protein ACOC8L_11125, partial [Spirochaetota bacterium]
ALSVGALEPGDTVAVSVQEGQLRTSPSFLGSIEEILQYGELVLLVEAGESWSRITFGDGTVEGWMHNSALEPPASLNLEGEAIGTSGTTSREIALAGRGFNEQVESEYEDQAQLDFSMVDEMETYLLPTAELAEFLTAISGDTTFGGQQ